MLATRPLGEADLLVVLLTPSAGKVRAAARHARKSKRRFAGGLPGGALGEATLHPARTPGGLWRLDGFRSLRDLSGLGRSLDRFAYVAYLCELTDALVREPEPDPTRFAALSTAIESTLSAPPDPGVLRRFELQLLSTLGLLPAIEECCLCGQPVPEGDETSIAFDPLRGGSLCHRHAGELPERVDPALLSLLAALCDPSQGDEILHGLACRSVEDRRWLRDLTAGLVRPHLDRALRSTEFLAQVSRR